MSRKLGARVPGVPPCVDLTPVDADARFILRTPPGQPGYLGAAHAGFEVQAVDRRNIVLHGVDPRRLADRRSLLDSFDGFRREVDTHGVADGLDEFQRQAFEVLTSKRLPSWKLVNAMPERVTAIEFGPELDGHAIVPMFLNASVGG